MTFENNLINKIIAFIKKISISKLLFYFIGIFSFLWILIRIIPKPSRASYPCVQASYPFASGFLIYLAGLLTSAYAYTRAISNFKKKQYFAFFTLILLSISATTFISYESSLAGNYKMVTFEANNPMGEAKGVIPGRVTWAFDENATNKYCSFDRGDEFFLAKNTDIDVVENMINRSILALSGGETLKDSWELIFKSFNADKGKGDIGYRDGEKIVIKCNFTNTNGCDQNYNCSKWANNVAKTTPQTILVILRHLINEVGIPQENIAFGDPMQCIIAYYYDLISNEFPDVQYIDQYGRLGRTLALKGTQPAIFYSDRGTVLRGADKYSDPVDQGPPVYQDTLYQVIENADYMINIAAMKAHESAGITLAAKNHFGSQTRSRAMHLHMGNLLPNADFSIDRTGYGKYRIQTDLMMHKMLGRNTMLVIIDGLWAGPSSGGKPVKFSMSPFNNDFTSSIFMSQDQVAIESVLFDFLKTEFSSGNSNTTTPQLPGVDDYLHQAADSSNWPDGIQYDPENNGEIIYSLGVHEHWNNSSDKQYSRNLDSGTGIDLHRIDLATSIDEQIKIQPTSFILKQNYPNPFNPETTIGFTLEKSSFISLVLFNSLGQNIKTIFEGEKSKGVYEILFNAKDLPSGTYFYRLSSDGFSKSRKMVFLK